MLYAADARWWAVYGDEALRTFGGEFWAATGIGGLGALWGCVSAAVRRKLQFVEVVVEPGLSPRPGRVNSGGNSGYQAIGLAHWWGAKRDYLLGYDMQKTGGQLHHHGKHEGNLPNLGDTAKWARQMVQLGIDLRQKGVEVINLTRQTALTCFERGDPAEVLR